MSINNEIYLYSYNKMSEINLYILSLDSKKYLLHASEESDTGKLIKECRIVYDYLLQYSSIKIEEKKVILLHDLLKIDYYVKTYMSKYGIDNVRGGTYSSEVLSDTTKRFLETELSTNGNDYKTNAIIMASIYTNYSEITEWDKNIISSEITKLTNELKEYYTIKDQLKSLKNKTINENYMIDRDIFINIRWLKNWILFKQYTRDGKTLKDTMLREENEYYKSILHKFKVINNIFHTILGKKIEYEPVIFLNEPKIVLDKFFYHIQHITNWELDILVANQLISKFEQMAYCVVNKIDELEFDISLNSPNFEKHQTCLIRYLETL